MESSHQRLNSFKKPRFSTGAGCVSAAGLCGGCADADGPGCDAAGAWGAEVDGAVGPAGAGVTVTTGSWEGGGWGEGWASAMLAAAVKVAAANPAHSAVCLQTATVT
jgi:hypothetical protein